LNTLKKVVDGQLEMVLQREPVREIVAPHEVGTADGIVFEIAKLAIRGLSPPLQAPVLGSTVETKASGLSRLRFGHCLG